MRIILKLFLNIALKELLVYPIRVPIGQKNGFFQLERVIRDPFLNFSKKFKFFLIIDKEENFMLFCLGNMGENCVSSSS
jgi:hypothetical protein